MAKEIWITHHDLHVNKFSLMNRSPNFHRENSDLKNSSNYCVSKFVENRWWTQTNLSMFPLNPCTCSSCAQIRYREKKPTTPDHHKSKDSCRNREACRNIWSGFILNSKTFCQKSFWEGWELCWFWVGWSAPIVSWLPRWAWRQSVARHLSCHQHPFVRPFSSNLTGLGNGASKPFLLRIILLSRNYSLCNWCHPEKIWCWPTHQRLGRSSGLLCCGPCQLFSLLGPHQKRARAKGKRS